MEKNDTTRESSLLLEPPGSLYSWSNMSSNSIFMPITVEKSDANKEKVDMQDQKAPISQVNAPLFSPNVSSKDQSICSSTSVSQLQQPLLLSKSPSPTRQASNQNIVSDSVHSDGNNLTPFPPQNVNYNSACESTTIATSSYGANYSTSVETFPCSSSVLNTTAISVPLSSKDCSSPVTSPACIIPQSESVIPGVQQYHNEPVSLSPNIQSSALNYQVVKPHWFYKKIIENKDMWYGFSHSDSARIEEAYKKYLQQPSFEDNIVPTDGNRYDVYIKERFKKAIYWEEDDIHVRRCTWFYKSNGLQRSLPYDETTSSLLEDLYCKCSTTGVWQQRLILEGGEVVVMEGPQTVLHYTHGLDVWPTVADVKSNPKIVHRGIPEEVIIDPDETQQVDHLVFIVQGIGSVCDLRFRTVSQCVDGFREIANRLIPIHFKHEIESGKVGRVEILPLAWHATIHTDHMGLDKRMQSITLPSIPKLRHFTNDTLLDILLYSSPLYCQAIMDTVGNNLNKLYNIFISRNPQFHGKVSVAGHSLGSLILFDILANQSSASNNCSDLEICDSLNEINLKNNETSTLEAPKSFEKENLPQSDNSSSCISVESVLTDLGLIEYLDEFLKEKIDMETLVFCNESELKDLGLPLGPRKKLLAFIEKEKLKLISDNVEKITSNAPVLSCNEQYAVEELGDQTKGACASFASNTACTSVFPINESKISMSSITFPRLDFNPACFFALGSPISMFLAVRGFETISEDFQFPTCQAFFHIFHPYDPVAFRIEPLIDRNFTAKPVLIPHHKGRKRMHIEIKENISKMGYEIKQRVLETLRFTWDSLSIFAKAHTFPTAAVEAEVDKIVQQQLNNESEDEYQTLNMDMLGANLSIGLLNGGRRIDYVLQEKPIEALNEYIFALTSHATYWDSEDTVLMILKEVYASQGIRSAPLSVTKEVKTANYLPGVSSSYAVSATTFETNTMYQNSYVPKHSEEVHNFTQMTKTNESLSVTPGVLPMSPNIVESIYNPSNNLSPSNVGQPSNISTQPIGAPPLSGFVRKSPFAKP